MRAIEYLMKGLARQIAENQIILLWRYCLERQGRDKSRHICKFLYFLNALSKGAVLALYHLSSPHAPKPNFKSRLNSSFAYRLALKAVVFLM
jgi:hypothetical protein